MDGFDVLNVKSAIKSRSHFKWDRRHLTSSDFGQIMIPFNEELVPGDDLNSVKCNFFARLAPLVKPTYGKCDFRTAAFFVPYHQVAEDIESWLSGNNTWMGSTPLLRYFTALELFNFVNGSVCSATGSASAYDFIQLNSSGSVIYKKLTPAGRYYVKLLNSLGYMIPSKVDGQSGSYWNTTGKNVKYNALPLLAFFKAYNDWMSQSQRYNTSTLSTILLCIRQNKTYTGYSPSTGSIGSAVLTSMFQSLKLNYENDYFTSAWQNPNAPLNQGWVNVPAIPVNSSGFGQPAIANVTTDFTVLNFQYSSSPSVAQLPALGLQFLKSFDDWVRRNNYSGSRDVQQIYSRFGIKVDDYKTHFAHLLKTTSSPLIVGDVTSTSDTVSGSTGAALGDYSGKGIVSDECSYSYKSSDYGLFIVLSWISVKPMNAYGFDRKVLRTSPYDFYNPEFDGIGADPISYDEVFVDNKTNPASDSSNGNMVYGFTERYNAYRCGYRDQITGDFRYYNDMSVWHFGRDLTALRTSVNMVAQSDSMNTLAQVNNEYDRIFSAVTSDSPDHFYFTCQFDVDFVRPMMSFNEVARLGVGETSVPRNGNTLN